MSKKGGTVRGRALQVSGKPTQKQAYGPIRGVKWVDLSNCFHNPERKKRQTLPNYTENALVQPELRLRLPEARKIFAGH